MGQDGRQAREKKGRSRRRKNAALKASDCETIGEPPHLFSKPKPCRGELFKALAPRRIVVTLLAD
jgi:hypothetical protein